MKKAKILSLLLAVLMLVQIIGIGGISMVSAAELDDISLNIPDGKQAIFTAKITREGSESVSIKLGSSEFFLLSGTTMKICGYTTLGTYGEGEYTVTAYINPAQKMTVVDVTLPDGGVVRRGNATIAGDVISINAPSSDVVSDVSVSYEAITVASYTLVETEPEDTVFSNKLRNLVTSFSDPATTRLFAWTGERRFSNNATMALKYREKGATDWISVDAVRQEETTKVADYDYFKVDLTGLKPATEYEYQIGKKGSTSTSQWSEIYSFTTAAEKVKDFSFIAIGDTQGYMWEHFQYTKAALDEAIKHVENPAFILHTGDVVDSGYQAYQWNRYFKALGTYGTNIANFVAVGNHDTRSDHVNNILTTENKNNFFSFYFNHPDAPADALVMAPEDYEKLSPTAKNQVDNFDETIYSYRYGNAHFIVLNTGTNVLDNGVYVDDEPIINAQRAWLDKELEENKDAKWKIIMCHEAVYHKQGGKLDRDSISDIIEKHGVDLVIEGHSHLITRTYPMKDGEIVTKASPDLIEKGIGTVYMTIGSTTNDHGDIGEPVVEKMYNVMTPDNAQPTYTTVSITGSELTLTTRQINGLVVDSFTIQGEEEPEPPTSEEITTEEPETEALTTEPTTEAPVDAPETTVPSDTTLTEEKKGGCGNSVSVAGLALIAALGTCTVFVAKKKRKED